MYLLFILHPSSSLQHLSLYPTPLHTLELYSHWSFSFTSVPHKHAMPVLKDNARIFPLRPLGLKEETENMDVCKGLTSWQSFPSQSWSQQGPVPIMPQAELGPSLLWEQYLSTRPTWDIPLNFILEPSRAESPYLSKTLRSLFQTAVICLFSVICIGYILGHLDYSHQYFLKNAFCVLPSPPLDCKSLEAGTMSNLT